MSKVIEIQLEWKYLPENYLEESISFTFKNCTLEIGSGIALAKVTPSLFHSDNSLRDTLTKKIQNRLAAIQMLSHKDYELSDATRMDIREDGSKNIYIELHSAVMTLSGGTLDLIHTDKHGNVITDTKRERLDRQNKIASLIEKYRGSDVVLDQMLKSYDKSVKDPDDELVHLYEIRDALSKKFRTDNNAIKQLDIKKDEWKQIGKFANVLPLNQGRHRGEHIGILRNAEQAELDHARTLVVNLIEKYLEYLENQIR